MMRTIIIAILFFITSNLAAQVTSSAICDLDSIEIGIPVEISIKLSKPKSIHLKGIDLSTLFEPITLGSYIHQPDSNNVYPKPDIEVNSLGMWDKYYESKKLSGDEIIWNIDVANGTQFIENKIRLTFWDPGYFGLIGPKIIFRDSADQKYYLPLEPDPFLVQMPQIEVDDKEQPILKPMKTIFLEEKNWKDYLFWIYLLIPLVLIAIILLYFKKFRKKKEIETKEIKVIIPVHEIALSALKKLREKQLWQKGEIKEYQSELTYIIRAYLSDRYEINALEKTTDEIGIALKNSSFDFGYMDKLKNILQMADLIKFAKATPDENIHEQFMNTAFEFVRDTKRKVIIQNQNDHVE